MVRRSALISTQTSALTSSMISSMLLVAWILLVTACSCFWNARRTLTSACGVAWWLSTALIADLLIASRRLCYPPAGKHSTVTALILRMFFILPRLPRLELEHLVVLQHARLQPSRGFLDLLHRELGLARLEVGDVHLGVALELGELFGQHRRAKVLGEFGQGSLLVGEGRLADPVLE